MKRNWLCVYREPNVVAQIDCVCMWNQMKQHKLIVCVCGTKCSSTNWLCVYVEPNEVYAVYNDMIPR